MTKSFFSLATSNLSNAFWVAFSDANVNRHSSPGLGLVSHWLALCLPSRIQESFPMMSLSLCVFQQKHRSHFYHVGGSLENAQHHAYRVSCTCVQAPAKMEKDADTEWYWAPTWYQVSNKRPQARGRGGAESELQFIFPYLRKWLCYFKIVEQITVAQ